MKKYILVTGASGGIGRAIATLLSESYPLILCGRNSARLEETRSKCANSNEHIFWNYDLANVENINQDLSTFIKNNNLSVSGFVHSAGIAPLSPLNLMTTAEMHNIMDVNFFSAAEILKLLTNRKINGKNLKSVVLISSILSSTFGAKGQSIYGASKGALEGFARAMAVELAPNVRINVICPGGIPTPIGDIILNNQELLKNSIDEGYILGVGSAEYIANAVEFLISEKAQWITGQIFFVDGGKTSHFLGV